MFRRKFLAAAAVAAVATLYSSPRADAAFSVRLSTSGESDLVVNDGGVGDVDGLVNGFIALTEVNFGQFSITSEIATSTSSTGVMPSLLTLQNTSVRNNVAGIGTLVITVEDDGFTAPANANAPVFSELQLLSGILTTGSGVSQDTFVDGVQVGPTLSLSTFGQATGSGNVAVGSSYELKTVTTVNLGANGVLVSQGQAVVVPAPPGLILAATALPLFGLLRRRLRRTAETPVAA